MNRGWSASRLCLEVRVLLLSNRGSGRKALRSPTRGRAVTSADRRKAGVLMERRCIAGGRGTCNLDRLCARHRQEHIMDRRIGPTI